MKHTLLSIFLISISSLICLYSLKYLSGNFELAGIFIGGVMFGIFLMFIRLNVKNKKIDIYKRELEKETISSDENAAKVKVLEAKINVLEKALNNALRK